MDQREAGPGVGLGRQGCRALSCVVQRGVGEAVNPQGIQDT